MIPLRLTIKNFMCYRGEAPILDLEGIHVACLSGDNGHGKTALLDAITWVLWGQTRARTQEELVHQGQQDMLVELDFIARAQRYRVNRRHSRGARNRQGTTILELQMNAGDIPQAITGNSIKDTEKLIREIQPDILVKGDDYKIDEVVGREIVEGYGAHVKLIPILKGHSTTMTLEKILASHRPEDGNGK